MNDSCTQTDNGKELDIVVSFTTKEYQKNYYSCDLHQNLLTIIGELSHRGMDNYKEKIVDRMGGVQPHVHNELKEK